MALVLALAASACVVLFAWGYRLKSARQPVPEDIRIAVKSEKRKGFGPLGSVVEPLGAPLAPLLLKTISPAGRGRLRRRIERAGRPGGMTPEQYASNKAGNFVLYGSAGLIGIMTGHLLIGPLLIAVGLFQTDIVLWNIARERQTEIQKTLPDFLDVLTVTVTAGLGFRHALARVSESMEGALADEMKTALRQMELGDPLRHAFEDLRQRNESEALASFVTAILQAEELGVPLAGALNEISTDMRRSAHQDARRHAQRVDPQVTLITTFFMVPGMIILILGMLYFGTGGGLDNVFG